jgi:DNA-binding LacI/PurR family transcriptional regulator
MIADAANVSVMTVSYALRDVAEVSPSERQRIQRIAETMGYRPDPLLTHLMQHLRSHRALKTTGNLAVLTSLEAGFVQRLLSGAQQRAERLGYTLDAIDARPFLQRGTSLTRTLLARGVSGVLLAPSADPANYSSLLDWSQFAAVAMTYSIVEPHVDRVVTHHFDNAVRAFNVLQQRGCKRIGMVMTRDMEFRANHSYSGAYFRAVTMHRLKPVPILFVDETDAPAIRRWYAAHRPQAIIVANANQVNHALKPALGAGASKTLQYLCLDYEEAAGVSGIDQLFEIIGSHAIDALVAHIHRNEKGLPEHPTVSMVEGRWVDLSHGAIARQSEPGRGLPSRTVRTT